MPPVASVEVATWAARCSLNHSHNLINKRGDRAGELEATAGELLSPLLRSTPHQHAHSSCPPPGPWRSPALSLCPPSIAPTTACDLTADPCPKGLQPKAHTDQDEPLVHLEPLQRSEQRTPTGYARPKGPPCWLCHPYKHRIYQEQRRSVLRLRHPFQALRGIRHLCHRG